MHARAPTPVYILGRFYSYTNIHYTLHYKIYSTLRICQPCAAAPCQPQMMPPQAWAALVVTLLLRQGLAAAAPTVRRTTCGGGYGWGGPGKPCPEPVWKPRWALNLSTAVSNIVNTPDEGSAWGLVTYPWNLNASYWQDVHPHPGEATMARQCQLVKALGTGTRCMVYRQNELSLQWQETSRAAQTAANAGMYLQFKTKALCEAAAPCSVAAFHQMSQAGKPLVACNRSAPVSAPNCAYCCNFSETGTGVYNEPIGGQWPSGLKPAAGDNALGDGQLFFATRPRCE